MKLKTGSAAQFPNSSMCKFSLVVWLIGIAAGALAQGTVAFQNGTNSLVKQWTSLTDSTLTNVPRGGGFVELIAAPVGTPLLHPLFTKFWGLYPNYWSLSSFLGANPGWAALAITPISSFSAGRFNGGTVTITDIAEGANADYMVIGWTGNYASYDAAIAASLLFPNSFVGISAIATTATGNPLAIPPDTPVPLSATFFGMTLIPVDTAAPEPSTVALASVGTVTLMLFRRRR
jgi:hypothetical protein